MHVVDTHHHRGARRCGRQRLDHPPQQLNGVGDTRLRPRGESTERNRPRRGCADRPPAFATLRLSSRQSLTGDPALAHTRRPVDDDPGNIRSQDGGLDSSHLLRAANQRPRQAHPRSLKALASRRGASGELAKRRQAAPVTGGEPRFIDTVARETIRVANVIERAIIAAVGVFGLAACSSSSPSQPQATTAGPTTRQPTVTKPVAPHATAAPSPTTPCLGLSICPPPPPDAEGNPACYYRDGWDADPSGSGINIYYFRESSNAASGEQVTADVRLGDGATASQIAEIDPGQSNDQIRFPGIDKSAVQEVLLTTSAGRCFVIGPNS